MAGAKGMTSMTVNKIKNGKGYLQQLHGKE